MIGWEAAGGCWWVCCRWERCWSGGKWMRLRYDGGCTERRRHGSGNGGTRCGCWREAGRPRPRPRRWNGTPTLLANGPRHSRQADRGRCHLSRREVPPALNGKQQAELKAAVPALPSQAGIELSNWNWKVVCRYVRERFGLALSRSSCLNYRHRLGFVLKRPKKQLVKADPARREAFVEEYAALTGAARRTGTKIFFADEAHFRADADLRSKWVLMSTSSSVIGNLRSRPEFRNGAWQKNGIASLRIGVEHPRSKDA